MIGQMRIIWDGATYGIAARDGEAPDERRKFGGRVAIDQG
jgi:hypothetical protein